MTRRDDTVALRHMLDHAVEAVETARGRTRADLDRDRLFSLAILKLVEIVGEAANRVSPTTQETHSQIPWGEIIGARNRLIHGYDAVDYIVLWDIVSLDLPPLIAQLQTILSHEPESES